MEGTRYMFACLCLLEEPPTDPTAVVTTADASMPTEGVLCLRMALEAGDHLQQDGGKKRASSNVDGGKVMCLRNVTNICCHIGPLR